MSVRISKSKFCAGVQCLKRLYLLVHEPELAAEPDGSADAIIEQGREVGLLARKLFPGGIEVYNGAGSGDLHDKGPSSGSRVTHSNNPTLQRNSKRTDLEPVSWSM